jgi:hypothetical protein
VDLLVARREKAPPQLVKVFVKKNWCLDHSEKVRGQGTEDCFNKFTTSSLVEQAALPSGQLPCCSVQARLQMCYSQSANSERQSEVGGGKGGSFSREVAKDFIKIALATSYRKH